MTYDPSDAVKITAEFTNEESGAFVDPGTVTAKIKDPAGTVTTFIYLTDLEVVRDSLGHFSMVVTPVAFGVWHYRWEGSGANQAGNEGSFMVRDSVF